MEEKRFEDKTMEEIHDDVLKKKQHAMNRVMKIRKYQLLFFSVAGIFYLAVYRNFLHPKSIMNSVLYHNALSLANRSKIVQ